jgi:hypothetical protein
VRSAIALVALLSACSSTPSGGRDAGLGTQACVATPECPDAGAPSYKNEIVRILAQDCIPCHSPTGTAGYDESSYALVYGQYGSMLGQVSRCAMPPLNGPQMDDAQRVALTAWLRCGAPEN